MSLFLDRQRMHHPACPMHGSERRACKCANLRTLAPAAASVPVRGVQEVDPILRVHVRVRVRVGGGVGGKEAWEAEHRKQK